MSHPPKLTFDGKKVLYSSLVPLSPAVSGAGVMSDLSGRVVGDVQYYASHTENPHHPITFLLVPKAH